MKKLFLTVTAIIVAVGVFASGMFPDVPETHWAYEYVKHLKDKGIVIGYPDGTFKGDRNITRYEEAAMISRLIGLLETEIVAPYISDVLKVLDAISVKLGSTIERVDALEKKLADVASAEQLGKVESELSKAIETLKQTVNIHEKDIVNLYTAISDLRGDHNQDVAELKAAVETLDSKLAEHMEACEAALSKIEKQIEDLSKDLLALEPVKNIVKDLTSYTRAQSNRITVLEEQVGDLSAMLDNAVKTLGYVSIKLDRLSEKLSNVEEKAAANEEAIAGLKEKVSANEEAFNAFKADAEKKFAELDEFKALHDEQIGYIVDELDSVNTQIAELRDGLLATREDLTGELEAAKTEMSGNLDAVKAELLKKIEDLSKANAALTGAVIGAIILSVVAMIVGSTM